MDPLWIALVVVGLVIASTLLGFTWQSRQGLVTRTRQVSLPPDVPVALVEATTRLTLLQFSRSEGVV